MAAIGHLRATGHGTADEAVAAYLREAAFTALNRFVALKMLEARGLVQDCISRGEQSSGFKEFCGLAPGLVQLPDHGYRLYIESLFDELSVHVRVLFDRSGEPALAEAAGVGGAARSEPMLARVQEEGSGFRVRVRGSGFRVRGPSTEPGTRTLDRDRLGARTRPSAGSTSTSTPRKSGSRCARNPPAPRNSRELAVRNQFFTPRYVVEFLTDNTLGRIWYEMTQGETRLKDQCRYLVRRPTEIFLAPGEERPRARRMTAKTNLSQEELLKQPVHIPHRPLKDPRDILHARPGLRLDALRPLRLRPLRGHLRRSLGHGAARRGRRCAVHRGLHALAADDLSRQGRLPPRRAPPHHRAQHPRHRHRPARRADRRALPLAARPDGAGSEHGLKPAERPASRRSNIVCAEPMPGEKELLREFVEQQFPAGERPAFARPAGNDLRHA